MNPLHDPAPVIRVLLVDDDADMAAVIGEALRTRTDVCFELESRLDFDAGLEAIRSRRHDVILVDLRLGDRSGLDLVQQGLRGGCDAPMILLTAYGASEFERKALGLGAADYLLKEALEPDTLQRSIRHALDRASTQLRLRESERQFRGIFEGLFVGMAIADTAGRWVDANPAACALFETTREELIGAKVEALILGDIPTGSGWRRSQFELPGASGPRLVEYDVSIDLLPDRQIFILRDVTDHRRVEEMRSRYVAAVEHSELAILTKTLDGVVTDWNAAAARDYGYTAAEMVGRSIGILVPAERHAEYGLLRDRLLAGEPVRNYETVRRRKDGRDIPVNLTMSLMRNASGAPDGISEVARDITAEKQLQARLAASDRLASLGTLAAGIAHEINNPLGFLMANLDFAIGALRGSPRTAELEEVARALEEARDGAERMQRTSRDIKTFARGEEEERGAVDVCRVLDSSIRLVGNELRHHARLTLDYASVPPVEANESRLGQVFLNLLVNAAQSIPEGKAAENEIRVSTRLVDGRVTVEIRDSGLGMPKEVLARVFEPFFTTKALGVGTGLGLSVSLGIVASLGGQIHAESEPGHGSTFRVTLPVAKSARAEPVKPVEQEKPGRRGRLLVVDDEPFMLRAILRCLGKEHDCVSTASAGEALQRVTQGEQFDLVLSDVMMPDMSGAELYEQIRLVAPRLAERMVFLSGGAFTPEARSFLERVPNRRIDKPFVAAALRATVRELIDRAS